MLLYAIVHSKPCIGFLNEVRCTICRKFRAQHLLLLLLKSLTYWPVAK